MPVPRAPSVSQADVQVSVRAELECAAVVVPVGLRDPQDFFFGLRIGAIRDRWPKRGSARSPTCAARRSSCSTRRTDRSPGTGGERPDPAGPLRSRPRRRRPWTADRETLWSPRPARSLGNTWMSPSCEPTKMRRPPSPAWVTTTGRVIRRLGNASSARSATAADPLRQPARLPLTNRRSPPTSAHGHDARQARLRSRDVHGRYVLAASASPMAGSNFFRPSRFSRRRLLRVDLRAMAQDANRTAIAGVPNHLQHASVFLTAAQRRGSSRRRSSCRSSSRT